MNPQLIIAFWCSTLANVVGMPSKSGIKDAVVSYAVGAGGGLLYSLSSAIFGNGFIGGILGAIAAGSFIKGNRGETLATVLGFQSLAGLTSGAAAPAAENTRGTM